MVLRVFALRTGALVAAVALGALTGCGGGGNSGGSPAPSRSRARARFDVNLKTGKVTVSPADGRAVFQGGAVTFASSDALTVSGDAGQRLIHITAANRSGQAWGASPVNLTVSNVVNADAAAIRANVEVSTYAGTPGSTTESDGYRTTAAVGTPWAVGFGAGPLAGSLLIGTSSTIRRLSPDGMLSTLAGLFQSQGFVDGTGSGARFRFADGLASDPVGNVYVADAANSRIRRVTPSGQVTTIAGTGVAGFGDGTGATATLNYPWSVAVSADGNRIYVSDSYNNNIRLIKYHAAGGGPRELATSYDVTTVAGSTAGLAGLVDGAGTAARFQGPRALCLLTDQSGAETLWLAAGDNNAIRRISSPDSAPLVTTVAGDGTVGDADGPGTVARFRSPFGITGHWIDSSSFVLFVTDMHRVRAVTYTAGGSLTQKGSYGVQTLAGGVTSGWLDGDGNNAILNLPISITSAGSGASATLYVADAYNATIRKVNVPGGALHTGGPAAAGLAQPRMLNADSEAAAGDAWTRRMTEQGAVWTGDVQFNVPAGVSGFSFLATIETSTNLVNLPAAGSSTLTTLVGGVSNDYADGLGREARLFLPRGVVAVPSALRSLYRSPTGAPIRAFIADTYNHRIRYLDTRGFVGNWAGSLAGAADGLGGAARFAYPFGLALCPDGSLLVAENNNAIRRIWPNQQVTTVAGLPGMGGSDDGPGSSARFGMLRSIAVTPGGRIYAADYQFHNIRRITLTGADPRASSSYTVETVAGLSGGPGNNDGVGAAARFNAPEGIAADTDGRIYVADTANGAVRMLIPNVSGAVTVSTLASGLSLPIGICLDGAHSVYVGDNLCHILRLTSGLAPAVVAGSGVRGLSDGPAGMMDLPGGLAIEETGDILFTEPNASSLRLVSRIVDTAAP